MNLETVLTARPSVAVLGDLMLDEWIVGAANRISPEAPVPVVHFQSRRTAPGGAANVATNLVSLGATTRIYGVVGDDEAARDLEDELRALGAEPRLVRDATRPTTLKTRVMAQSQQQAQQLLRIDRESDAELSADVRSQLETVSASLLQSTNALCLSDYDKGMAQSGAFTAALEAAQARGILVTAGPKPRNLACFSGADFLSFNLKEACEAVRMNLPDTEAVEGAGAMLLVQTEARALAITRGAAGVSLFVNGRGPLHFPAHAVEVFDGVGAGDTFLAAATLALAAGADFEEAVELGNLAAACSVRHVGVVAVKPDEIRNLARQS